LKALKTQTSEGLRQPAEIYINGEDPASAQSADMYHELRHVYQGNFGLTPAAAAHGAPGVNAQIEAAEREALLNAAQQ